jgi:hypothetical protein
MTTAELKIAPGMYVSACRKAGTYNGKVSGQVTYNGRVEKVAYTDTDTMVVIRLVDNTMQNLTNVYKTVYLSSLSGWLTSDYAW